MLIMNESIKFGDTLSKNIFIQLVDEHDMEVMNSEIQAVHELSENTDWCIEAIPVSDWNNDLTPWQADPVFGKEGFGDGAAQTLQSLLGILKPDCSYFLCGYSLAGLFALWAAYQTDVFSAVAAASPSVWYPDWINYAENNMIKTSAVYLSLGDKEEKTKNPVMSTVANAIRRQSELLSEAKIKSTLEWNPGNHFKDSDKRVAKGIAWVLQHR